MSAFAIDPEVLKSNIVEALGEKALRVSVSLGEVTVYVSPENYLGVAKVLHDSPICRFETLVDLCGVDYSQYKDNPDGEYGGGRFCVVSHLLSVSLNQRVRLKVFAPESGVPVVASLTGIWSSVNWFEREAFDLFGIVFDGHDDLRRILTDYGFIGHPFRKDFPTTGHVEMRYDAEQKRVIYQPVSIEPREITPRIIREDNYGGLH
jgi:NADH-quinone oxidoreductase subunit C